MKEDVSRIIKKIDEDLQSQYPKFKDPSLFNGLSGVILFYHQLYISTKKEEYLDIIYDLLDEIIESISAADNFSDSLCDGLAGIAYIFNFLHAKKIVGNDLRKPLNELDEILLESVKTYVIHKNNDFLH